LTGVTVNSPSGTITVSPVATSLTITYNAAEGNAVGPTTVSQYWQSAFTTNDGTLLDWGTSDHGVHQDNSVREYDPLTKTQTRVFARQNYGTYAGVSPALNPGGPAFPAGAIPVTQYDNHPYIYVPRLNSLVILSRGQYRRANNDWPYANRSELRSETVTASSGAPLYSSGLPDDNGQLGWAAGTTGVNLISTNAASLIRPGPGIDNVDPFFLAMFVEDYNPHIAWSGQFDCGVRIGGAASNEWVGFFAAAGDKALIFPGGPPFLAGSPAGVAVGTSTKNLLIENLGAVSVTVGIQVAGTSS
jgi:hypothetical protein